MTNQNDWQRFVEMMTAAGWTANYCDDDVPTWYFGDYQYQASGWLTLDGGRHPRNVGDWCEWLKAGQTPQPW